MVVSVVVKMVIIGCLIKAAPFAMPVHPIVKLAMILVRVKLVNPDSMGQCASITVDIVLVKFVIVTLADAFLTVVRINISVE